MDLRFRMILLVNVILLLAIGCSEEKKEIAPLVKLKNLKSTDFLPTIEHKVDINRNAVYCATLLFAWEETRKNLDKPIKIGKEYDDLNLLHESKSFKDVLAPDEYTVSAEVEENAIRARAEFSRSLPFELKWLDFPNELKFNNEKVKAFGLGPYSYDELESLEILYYKNNEDFIIKLKPKDKEHEIILYKINGKNAVTMNEFLKDVQAKIKIGQKEQKDSELGWKFFMGEEDELVIPKIKFNIEHDYPKMVNSRLIAGIKSWYIEKAYQRTAFVLDEKGAIIESEAEMASATEEEPMEEKKPRPKLMRFDSSFLVLLKKKGKENPYFALWVANTELLEKEQVKF